eukprot:1824167-Prymnesium_polylepis.1
MPAYRLNRKLFVNPITWKLGRNESVPALGAPASPGDTARFCSQFHSSPLCVSGTALGVDVEPE